MGLPNPTQQGLTVCWVFANCVEVYLVQTVPLRYGRIVQPGKKTVRKRSMIILANWRIVMGNRIIMVNIPPANLHINIIRGPIL